MIKVTCSVPPGSLSFYIQNIFKTSGFILYLYADDTNLFCWGKNLKQHLDTHY